MKFKAIENELGIMVIVVDEDGTWYGEIAEHGYETIEQARKAAKNFAEWN